MPFAGGSDRVEKSRANTNAIQGAIRRRLSGKKPGSELPFELQEFNKKRKKYPAKGGEPTKLGPRPVVGTKGGPPTNLGGRPNVG